MFKHIFEFHKFRYTIYLWNFNVHIYFERLYFGNNGSSILLTIEFKLVGIKYRLGNISNFLNKCR